MFNEILRRVTGDTPGGIGATLMGYDGIAIATELGEATELDIQMIAVEYANVLKEIRNAAGVLAIGELEEVDIQTVRYGFLIRAVTDEYFIALTIRRDGNFGKGRFVLRRELEALRQALL